jgi:hypothetical protein
VGCWLHETAARLSPRLALRAGQDYWPTGGWCNDQAEPLMVLTVGPRAGERAVWQASGLPGWPPLLLTFGRYRLFHVWLACPGLETCGLACVQKAVLREAVRLPCRLCCWSLP